MFLSLVVLCAGTLFCGISCLCLVLSSPNCTSGDRSKKQPIVFKKGYKPTTDSDQPPHPPDTRSGQQSSSPVDERARSSSQDLLLKSAAPATAPYAEGDAAAGGSSGRMSIPVADSANNTSGLSPSVMSPPARADKAGGGRGASMSDDARAIQLHKTSMGMAPLSRSQGTRDFSAQEDEISKSGTPSRLGGIGNLLGNATPARLRRLAGRMSGLSPALSGASSRRSKRSSSGSSSRSRSRSRKSRGSHRRQETFPGVYSQRNLSEMDHQRPPADPVYTFMIKTIAAKGFKFMSTTEIAFCAMRMYSHFKRTEGNYKRLAVMKNAESVPPVYEIIWICDAKYEQLGQGQSRFFSTGKGTDAEQEKSLLACLLALSWDDSNSGRRTLQRALSPFKASRVPTPEDMFWDDFKECTDALSGDDQMVVLARVILLIAQSANKPPSNMVPESPLGPGKADDGGASAEANENGVEYGDIMKALSATHLRDVGISLKTSRPGWQEAHVQLVSVLLVIAFLEEGAKNAPPGGERPDPLSSLEWVGILTPEALDGFLVEKLEARRALVELDLEPSGLVIKHDEEGEVERVEPAIGEKKETFGGGSWRGSRGHQRILPRSSDRKSSRSRRNRRGKKNSESNENKKSHSPVVITTINRNKAGVGDRAGGAGGAHSRSSTPGDGTSSAAASGGDGSQGIRTIAQQRGASSSHRVGGGGGGAVAETPKSKTTSLPNPTFSGERGAGGEGYRASPPQLTITAIDLPGRSEEGEDDSMPSNGVHISPSGESADHRSEASSVVTRVYAPSSCTEDQVAFSRAGTSWVVEDSSHGQQSPLNLGMSQASAVSPHGVGMSQASVAGSRMSSPPVTLADMQRLSERSAVTGFSQGTAAGSKLGSAFGGGGTMNERTTNRSAYAIAYGADTVSGSRVSAVDDSVGLSQDDLTASELRSRQPSPSSFSVAAESETAFSEAASRFDAPGYQPASSVQHHPPARVGDRLGIDTSSPTSAAGSRFEGSPSSNATFMSRIAGGNSPSGVVHGRDAGPMTGRSVASSMRSTDSSFFQPSSSRSHRSGESRTRISSAASVSSWDEEDLQNMGTRWLSERAYNQQFDAHNQK